MEFHMSLNTGIKVLLAAMLLSVISWIVWVITGKKAKTA